MIYFYGLNYVGLSVQSPPNSNADILTPVSQNMVIFETGAFKIIVIGIFPARGKGIAENPLEDAGRRVAYQPEREAQKKPSLPTP